MIKAFNGIEPNIDESVFVAGSADIIGDVTISKNASIWYNAVIRGDEQPITIGENTNIQDGSVVHTGYNEPTRIGNNVTVGHKALVHGCKIGDNTLIGMGAIVLDGAEVGEFTLLGAGSLVPPGKKIPSGVLAMGSPAKVIRELSDEEKENLIQSSKNYVETAKKHK
ncbi:MULTISPECIES: gamma carbonic anhydrase family protein [unclassified Romboutsia]|uniref:gamma carbonic anhydrase family protein n=1 Tax=unclassified Romboutsia TaxID=2626894 RepID=UPI0008220434|nr:MULTISPECIES: gamma carbonic anhydrase family protein [unclassified Romboutsia]SCI03794.1 carnitine operon protein CaiE [uncultured Clostridium sp.]